MRLIHVQLTIMVMFLLLVLLSILLEDAASAHEAPTGWTYPPLCCGNGDCRQVENVPERPDGYHVMSGEVLAYGDYRIKDSPDGEFHWCSTAGSVTGNTICLFVPSRGF